MGGHGQMPIKQHNGVEGQMKSSHGGYMHRSSSKLKIDLEQ